MIGATLDSRRIVCRFADLTDPGSKGFSIDTGDWPLRGFVVRKGGRVFGYLNRCPHAGHPLNMLPDEFLTLDRELLICRSHGACFEISTGLCVAGPCTGASLRPIPLLIEHEHILLASDAETLAAQFA